MACIPLMAEEGVFLFKQTLSKTGASLTIVLLNTGFTRKSIGVHLRGRGKTYVDQASAESINLAKGKSAGERVNETTKTVDLLNQGKTY